MADRDLFENAALASVLVDFGDAGQTSDVFPVLLRRGFEILDVSGQQFEGHYDGFDAFVDGHGVTVSMVARRRWARTGTNHG